MAPPHKYLLVLDGADHFVFGGAELPRRRTNNDAVVQRNVRFTTHAFWKAWLDDDAQAKAMLTLASMRDALTGAGTWSAK